MDGKLFALASSPFTSSTLCALAAHATALGGHVGLLYSDEDDELHQFHLCAHNDLTNEPLNESFKIWVQPQLPKPRLTAIAEFIVLVANRNVPKFPYGFSGPGGWFDKTGARNIQDGKIGLTCATLVLAILESVGVSLLDYKTWKSREDDQTAQAKLVWYLERQDPVQAQAVRSELPCVRYRPYEVVGSATEGRMPVGFETAVELAGQVEEFLRCLEENVAPEASETPKAADS